MKKVLILTVTSILLAGCGTQAGDRMISGAGIGAGAVAIAGPIGIGTGAVIGGVTGVLTPSKNVNLGKPAWKK
jgi:osmotically inducible lipoprotein OsmB